MPMSARLPPFVFLASLLPSSDAYLANYGEEVAALTLDAGNFSKVVARHHFIVVQFYAPWCGHCKQLAAEAGSVLSRHDPPVVLAKVDASDEANKDLAGEYIRRQGFPTVKILRNRGRDVREYSGPRDADGIVEHLRKQAGPASVEIRSPEPEDGAAAAAASVGDKGVAVVGVFPEFCGVEYENFMAVAEKMRGNYDFRHTLDAGVRGRAAKGLSSGSSNRLAMFFLSFGDDRIEAFKDQFYEAAKQYNGNNISLLIRDVTASQGAFELDFLL